MNSHQTALVKKTWQTVAALDPTVVGQLFYNRLFEVNPELKRLFKSPVTEQSKKLITMISYVIAKLDNLEEIAGEVGKLAVRHSAYGVRAEHYAMVGEALLWTLEKGLQESWNAETEEAWTVCYRILSNAMIVASSQDIAA